MSDPASSHQLLPVHGAYIQTNKVHEDERGTFSEIYRYHDRKENEAPMVQQNVSFSFMGVLRGMHTQKENPQGKLVTCVYGSIWDVIYDIRKDSPTFGKGAALTLDFKSGESLYVPPGCLHGFLALSRFAVVHYSCTAYYDAKSDGGVRWDSPELREFFPEDIMPIVSAKDQNLPLLSEYLEQLK